MKILISHSYFIKLDPKEFARKKPYPPLATLTIAGWIRQELNIQAIFYDIQFDNNSERLIATIKNEKPDIVLIYDDDFNYLSKMCLTNMRNEICTIVNNSYARRPLFLIHSSDASDQADYYLHTGFDFVIHKNAEATCIELLKQLQNTTHDFQLIDGISYKLNSEIIHNQERKTNPPIEKQASPEWSLIDLVPYRTIWKKAHGFFSLNISASHGCPFNCNWCAKPLYGRVYKNVSVELVIEQFRILSKDLKADHLWLTDDIFGLNPHWLTQFADQIEQEQIKIPYTIQSRAGLMNQQTVHNLKRSGCETVWLGVESGSQKILDAMDKETTIEEIIAANAMLKENGINSAFFLQYGYPGEDYTDIRKTLKLLRHCLPDTIGISVSYPLKGTIFYEQIIESMQGKLNWTDSGDLDLMFPGKYHPNFYRALHRFTHHYFAIISLFKKQTPKHSIRRLFSMAKHIPAYFYKRLVITYYLQISK